MAYVAQTLNGLLLLLVVAVALPTSIFALQVLASRWPRRQPLGTASARPRMAVLVPAHDEALGIAATLKGLLAQLSPSDRLLVVADNCSDDTAAVARAAGAEVTVRSDTTRRGKGYALDHGVRVLAETPPDIVIIVDADCVTGPDCLATLAMTAARTGRPVQALYLMRSPGAAGLGARIGELAWTIRNQVRPLGWHRLGLPCQLMGSGMAFPYALLRSMPLASGHIVEDLKLGFDAAQAGLPPLFCPQALVTSLFPTQAADRDVQRSRWEHGHLSLLFGMAPRMVLRGLARGQLGLLALAVDLSVPPLAALAMSLMLLTALACASAWWTGQMGVAAIAGVTTTVFLVSVLLAWWRHGRQIVALRELLFAPVYAMRKLSIYGHWLGGRQATWVRSARDAAPLAAAEHAKPGNRP